MTTNPSGRILGIDYGTKRVGIAMSDPLLITAQPAGHFNYKDLADLIAQIKVKAEEYGVSKIVVGAPKTMKDTNSEMSLEVAAFVKELVSNLDKIEIITWDERLTSAQAERILIEGGVSREKRKQKIDSLAASIMLQSYLDYLVNVKSQKHEIKN